MRDQRRCKVYLDPFLLEIQLQIIRWRGHNFQDPEVSLVQDRGRTKVVEHCTVIIRCVYYMSNSLFHPSRGMHI